MDPKKKKRIIGIVGGIVLYLISTGLAYGVFTYLSQPSSELVSPVTLEESRGRVDLSAPKTEACPLNGKMFTKDEKGIWEERRPLTVMIENHAESRPQSGLSFADVVYEVVAEGGITRFLAIYYCGASAEDITIGPVRSARTYFLDWASEYGDYPLYAHVGGANLPGAVNALGQIGQYGWLAKGNDLNQFSLGFPVFWRDYERIGHPVATEHTMYSSTDKLWEIAQERGLGAIDDQGDRWDEDFTAWKFRSKDDEDRGGDVGQIKFNFWSGLSEYQVSWEYGQEKNLYQRLNGGEPHKDLNNDQQIEAGVVVIQFAQERGPVDELKHLLYTTTGQGEALVFQGGKVIKARWSKAKRESRTVFKNSKGQEIDFNSGPIWVEIVPVGQEVSY